MTAMLYIPRLDCEVELDGRLTVLRGEDALAAKPGHLNSACALCADGYGFRVLNPCRFPVVTRKDS